MATPHACAALADVFPDLLRTRRALVGTQNTPAIVALTVVLQHGPLRISEVADHLALDLSTVSRQISHLRQRGLLDSSPDPADGRSQRLSVTPAGLDELRTFRRAVVGRLVDHLDDWGDDEVEQLTRLLGRLTRPEPPPGTVDLTHHQSSPTRHEMQLQGNA